MGAPWTRLPLYAHETTSVEVSCRDGKLWIAGGCETPKEMRDLAALLEYLAAEAESGSKKSNK